ncbi:MAG TPA: tetratricopeptide repeat protein [Labilithrix sp.]
MKLRVALAILTLASAAHADTPPTVWDRAKDPTIETSYALHLDVMQLMENARLAERVQAFLPSRAFQGDADIAQTQITNAVEKLERFGAAKSSDVRLRFDLAAAYIELARFEVDRRARMRQAMVVLREALALAPEHPMADEGWWNLGIACGYVGDTHCEHDSYVETLRRRTEEEGRATPMLNLAETEMHLGNLKGAVEGYRETIRLAGKLQGDPLTAPLAMWGLAVALDRSGEHVRAEQEAKAAVELELASGVWRRGSRPRALEAQGVFFYPDYEVHWYFGLECVALAHVAKSADDAARLLRMAEGHFTTYVRGAEPDKDRWLEMAKARLAAAKSDREKAEQRAAREPRPKRNPDADPRGITF